MPRTIEFRQAINEALHEAMAADPAVICYGLGVPDPRHVFETTTGLQERFGPERVFDTPTSENALTGIAVGAGLTGLRPIMTHQRVDFFLLAMDQLVNSAAKWHYTFRGRGSVPITIRLIVGRGWGQGPTHSQSLQAWFTHVPGLKVVMPTSAADAKGLLLSSIFDDNPVVFIEHRWLHNLTGNVPEGDHRVPLAQAALMQRGADVTIASMSYMTIEAARAADHLRDQGVTCDLLDLRTLSPMDWPAIFESVSRTGRLLALDTGWPTCSVASEIVARVCTERWDCLKTAPRTLALPDFPIPAGFSLTRGFYPGAADIVRVIGEMLTRDLEYAALQPTREDLHDVPGDWFKGPF